MSSLEGEPSSPLFPPGSSGCSPQARKDIFLQGIRQVVNRFVDVSFPAPTSASDDDHVQAYAREVLSLGLLFLEFTDAIREGDGLRILRCWKYFLPLFKASKRTNYSIEAFTMLMQHEVLFSPRMQHQLLWNRTVNTQGRPGKNIPCDLHMEHINRTCKNAIGLLGPNVSREGAISRVGKSVGQLSKVTASFDKTNGVSGESGKRSRRTVAKDVDKLLKQVHHDSHVFKATKGRYHTRFRNFKRNAFRGLKSKDLTDWMNMRLKKLVLH